MDTVAHLWNVNRHITNLKCQQSRNLQTFYMQCCRNMGDKVELPKQHFGPSVMCAYCGSLWHTMDFKIHVVPSKKMSKSIKRLSRRINASDERVPKVRMELVQKCIRNEMNKLVIKCSVCLKNTEIPLMKPKRQKLLETNTTPAINLQSSQKKKKKRNRDKSCGLNISGCSTPTLNINSQPKESMKLSEVKAVRTKNVVTPTPKLKKMNINRLKDIVNQGVTPLKRRSLHNFLKDLD